jgi:hypothetical protein
LLKILVFSFLDKDLYISIIFETIYKQKKTKQKHQ